MLPSAGEFFKTFGLTPEKLALAKPDAIVMHPGPDQPRRRDRFGGRRRHAERDPAAGHLRHRGAHGGDVDHRGAVNAGREPLRQDHPQAHPDPRRPPDRPGQRPRRERRPGDRRRPHRRARRGAARLRGRARHRRERAGRRARAGRPRGAAARAGPRARRPARVRTGRGGRRRRHQPGLPARHRSGARRAGAGRDAEVPRAQPEPVPALSARRADARARRRGADRDGRADRGRLRRLLAGRGRDQGHAGAAARAAVRGDLRLHASGCVRTMPVSATASPRKGALATRLGLSGVPVVAETIALATIIELVRDTGARVHLCAAQQRRRRRAGARARRPSGCR